MGVLKDKVADSLQDLEGIIFGENFGKISDIQVGPDGYLYILTHYKNNAQIFRIVPINS